MMGIREDDRMKRAFFIGFDMFSLLGNIVSEFGLCDVFGERI